MFLPVKIKLSRGMEPPTYATPGSAALDLRAALEPGETVTIEPGGTASIPTGISLSPGRRDVVAILAARSGLGTKHGIVPANGIGVIDSDYRGEIHAVLRNHGKESFTIARGDRIAQLMFVPVWQADFEVVETLDETERGQGGFGSTGVQ